MRTKKLLIGGLLVGPTGKIIKTAYKAYLKQGGRKIADIVKQGHNSQVTRNKAKSDLKFNLQKKIGSEKTIASIMLDNLKNKTGFHNKDARALLKKRKQLLTDSINKLK
jgi:hypothetical protein